MIDWIIELISSFVAAVLEKLGIRGWIILLLLIGATVLACVYL